MLPTIRSRTQHFEFRLLTVDELTEHARWVCGDAGLEVAETSIAHAVKQGRGSVRDMLSALDQVIATGGVFERPAPLEELFSALADGSGGPPCSPSLMPSHKVTTPAPWPRRSSPRSGKRSCCPSVPKPCGWSTPIANVSVRGRRSWARRSFKGHGTDRPGTRRHAIRCGSPGTPRGGADPAHRSVLGSADDGLRRCLGPVGQMTGNRAGQRS
ncbi:MAG: hypothetical protein M5U19_02120 [Microthrixaceae bacterium]|nr:hypothetical protein [Microthrixaceae bacterium]